MKIPTSSKNEDAHRLFPIDAFPMIFTQAGLEIAENHGFSTELVFTAMLSAMATAIGSSYKIQGYEPDYFEHSILWIAIIAYSGAKKSAIVKKMLKPIADLDLDYLRKYRVLSEEFEYAVENCSKSKGKDKPSLPPKPKLKKTIVKKFTIPGLMLRAQVHPKGQLVDSDEFIAWLNNLNQYDKGQDTETVMSLHTGDGYSFDYATKEPIVLERTNINIVGGVQPGKLPLLVNQNSINNGFTHRLIFSYCTDPAKYPPKEISESIAFKDYCKILRGISELPPDQGIIHFDDDAQELLYKWKCRNVDTINEMNEIGKEHLGSLYAKGEANLLRFALILHIANSYAADTIPGPVPVSTLNAAIVLHNHYIENSQAIYQSCNIDAGPKLDWQRRLIKSLPESFTTQKALEQAEPLGISQRSIYDLLADDKLFIHETKGQYRKRGAQ